jgi:hypothetical protein
LDTFGKQFASSFWLMTPITIATILFAQAKKAENTEKPEELHYHIALQNNLDVNENKRKVRISTLR